MTRRKTGETNASDPKGSIPARKQNDLVPDSESGWMASSFDLGDDVDVTEDDIETVPAQLLEHLFFESTR